MTTDRPLKNGVIETEDGTQIPLQPGANGLLTAKVPMQKSGLYHFAALDQGQSVRLSPLDYFIEAQDDQPPTVRITHPGADARGAADRGSQHRRHRRRTISPCRVWICIIR